MGHPPSPRLALVFGGLEAQAEADLEFAWRVDLVRKDLTEAGGADVGVRTCELDAIEGVEELHAKVKAEGLGKLDAAGCEHIEVDGARGADISKVALGVAELEGGRRVKAAGLK